MNYYPLEVLQAAERRAIAAAKANSAERARASANTEAYFAAYVERQRDILERNAYRGLSMAMALTTSNVWRGQPRRAAALVAFEWQWQREKRWLRRRKLRIWGHDATEQFVRCIRLWRVAGFM